MPTFKNLFSLVRKPKVTSADLAAAIVQAKIEGETAAAAFDKARSAYETSLLSDDLKAAVVARESVTAAEVECDRIRALFGALENKLKQQREAEVREALDAARDAAETEAETVAGLLRARYPAIARELVALLQRLGAAEKGVASINERLLEAGRDDRLADVEWRALPRHPGEYEELYSIQRQTTLVELSGFSPGWNFVEPQWPGGIGAPMMDSRAAHELRRGIAGGETIRFSGPRK
jgi:hypothetical protein